MRKVIVSCVLLFFASSCLAQLSLSPDTVYQTVKTNSVFRNNVDWSKLGQEFRIRLDTAKTLKDTMSSFIYLFRQFDDPHSAIYLNNNYYGYYRKYEDSFIKRVKPLLDRDRLEIGKVRTAFLENKFVYIRIPGIMAWGTQIDSFARIIDEGICAFPPGKVKGFIVDLRLNSGGNIYPMLSGLGSLLGDAYLGAEVDASGKINSKWELKDGNFLQAGHRQTTIKSKCSTNYSKYPVTVLLGPITKSSGSMTAIAFKGRPNSYFIGEPTADGYTTVNSYYQMRDNFVLNIATAFVADRNNNIYKTVVNPDRIVYGSDNFDNLLQDDKIKVALKWLYKNNSR